MSVANRTSTTPEEYTEYKSRFSNWNRWGADDQLGALNYITTETRRLAAGLVSEGLSISCALPIATRAVVADERRNMAPADHRMRLGPTSSSDYIGLSYHGWVNTHIDALCHFFTGEQGEIYNGRPSSMVTEDGAQANGIDQWRDGIATRGVLFDIPRMRGIDHVEVDRPVEGWDLENFAQAHGIEPRAGDAVLIRSGLEPFWCANPDFPFDIPPSTPGVGASVLEYLHAHDAALLGWDLQEIGGHGLPAVFPVHEVAIPYMGMAILDNMDFERLATACAERDRYEFMFTVAPLVVIGGTGSPVNPIATL